jgi:hypothetical protein
MPRPLGADLVQGQPRRAANLLVERTIRVVTGDRATECEAQERGVRIRKVPAVDAQQLVGPKVVRSLLERLPGARFGQRFTGFPVPRRLIEDDAAVASLRRGKIGARRSRRFNLASKHASRLLRPSAQRLLKRPKGRAPFVPAGRNLNSRG